MYHDFVIWPLGMTSFKWSMASTQHGVYAHLQMLFTVHPRISMLGLDIKTCMYLLGILILLTSLGARLNSFAKHVYSHIKMEKNSIL